MVRIAFSIFTLALFTSLAACTADTDEPKQNSDDLVSEGSSTDVYEGGPAANEKVGVEIAPRPFVEKQKQPSMVEDSRIKDIRQAAEPAQSGKKD